MSDTPEHAPIEVSFIVAVCENGVIGRDGDLPWRLSTDLKRFKSLTMGRPVIMGRKTFRSIGKALPGRENVVVTRDPGFSAEGVNIAASIEEAFRLAEGFARRDGQNEVAVIGGGQIYAETFDRATVLHVTHVETVLEGDTVFPPIDPLLWQSGDEERVPKGPKDAFSTRFVTYRRRREA